MPEPKVGMSFGSFSTVSSLMMGMQNNANGEVKTSKQDNIVSKTINFTRNGKIVAHGSAKLNTYPILGEYKCSASFWAQNEKGERLIFTGNRYDQKNDDIIFDKIRGTKTEAVDLNHNGIVDDDEIFECSKKSR